MRGAVYSLKPLSISRCSFSANFGRSADLCGSVFSQSQISSLICSRTCISSSGENEETVSSARYTSTTLHISLCLSPYGISLCQSLYISLYISPPLPTPLIVLPLEPVSALRAPLTTLCVPHPPRHAPPLHRPHHSLCSLSLERVSTLRVPHPPRHAPPPSPTPLTVLSLEPVCVTRPTPPASRPPLHRPHHSLCSLSSPSLRYAPHTPRITPPLHRPHHSLCSLSSPCHRPHHSLCSRSSPCHRPHHSLCSLSSPCSFTLFASCCAFFLRRQARDANLFFSLRERDRTLAGWCEWGERSLMRRASRSSSLPSWCSLRGFGVMSLPSPRRAFPLCL